MTLPEEHLWMSLLLRPLKSRFTRVQRLSSLLALLFLTMITNAMFFRSSEEMSNVEQVDTGLFKFSHSVIYVSLVGILITTPPILLITILFKKRKCECDLVTTSANKPQSKYNKDMRNVEDDLSALFVKKEFLFPYWTVYLAWVLIVLSVVSSGFFLLLYSMEWGKLKSEEWLYSFYLSFFESVVFIDPIKVVLLAILSATLLRKFTEEQTDIDVSILKKLSNEHHYTTQGEFKALVNKLIKKEPPTEEEIKYMRQKHKEQLKAKAAFLRMILFIVFIFVLFTISFHERDARSFALKSNIENYLLADGYGQFGFVAINQTKYFFDWIQRTLIPALYPDKMYNGESLGARERRWFGDLSSVRVGPPRIRQIRMKSESCSYQYLTFPYPCIPGYRESEEDTDYYCFGWETYNQTRCGSDTYKRSHYTAKSWSYTHSDDIWGISRTGDYGTYSGGGYIIKMGNERENGLEIVEELVRLNWIDRKTRAIFVEFTTFNPNVNLFVFSLFLLEAPESGGVITWTDVQAFRPFVSVTQFGTMIVLCYLLFILHLIVFSVRIVVKMYNSGIRVYFREPWNSVDLISVILENMSVSLYIARYVYAKRASVMFYDDQLVGSNKFINFSHVVIWDTIFNTVFGCLLFVNVIKAFRILGYNKRFIQIISVLTDAIEDIVGFSVVFILVFFAFVASGNLLFGSKLKDYRSFLSTCGSLTNSFIGKNKLDTLVRASPNAAQFFYIAYIGCVIMTLMTIFVAILNKSISLVKSQATSAPPIFGIANFIQNVVRKTLTILGFSRRLVAKKIENYQELYIHPSEGFQTTNIVRLMRGILDNTFHPETHNQSKKNSEEAEKFYFEGENRVSETQTKISENLSDSILSKETVGRLQVRRSILKRIMGLRGYKEPAGKEFDNFDDILSLDMRNKRKHQAQKRILKKVVGVSALDTPHSGKSDPLAVNLLYL